MKHRIYHIIFAFGFSVWIVSCGSSVGGSGTKDQQEKTDQTPSIIPAYANKNSQNDLTNTNEKEVKVEKLDMESLLIDTTLYLSNYHMIIGKEKFNTSKEPYTSDDLEFNSIVIYFTLKDNDSVVLKKTFEENQFVKLVTFKEKNTQYISLSNYTGGSGFQSTLYQIKLNEKPSFVKVLSYNELTFYTFSKDGSELLYLQGNWDMSEAEDESHFSDHRYTIATIGLGERTPGNDILHGTSKQKYPSYDYETTTEMLIQTIHKKEPDLFKDIMLGKYGVL